MGSLPSYSSLREIHSISARKWWRNLHTYFSFAVPALLFSLFILSFLFLVFLFVVRSSDFLQPLLPCQVKIKWEHNWMKAFLSDFGACSFFSWRAENALPPEWLEYVFGCSILRFGLSTGGEWSKEQIIIKCRRSSLSSSERHIRFNRRAGTRRHRCTYVISFAYILNPHTRPGICVCVCAVCGSGVYLFFGSKWFLCAFCASGVFDHQSFMYCVLDAGLRWHCWFFYFYIFIHFIIQKDRMTNTKRTHTHECF